MDEITKNLNISEPLFQEYKKKIKNISQAKELINSKIKQETTELVDAVISCAIILDSSDIHIEPEEKTARLRFRIDGNLCDIIDIPLEEAERIISRIKLLSGLKINIKNKAQDGRFSINISGMDHIESRSSSIPTNNGESIVLRILNSKNLFEIENLGLNKLMLETVNKEISKPNGMILVTGPTGSGKTTTLYAILKKIRNPENKIITIEDPIEYKLEDITQTQVDSSKGYDFANGLKSIVRQDPDVILVGEIRDEETCQTALQSALTGHLVLSTLHTNDAVGSIARLQALGAQDYNIGPAINIVIAQRLVRKICKQCAKKESAPEGILKEIKRIIPLLPEEMQKELEDKKEILIPQGCEECNFTGYKGRIGIYEILPIDKDIENAILEKKSIADTLDLATKKGMITMRQDGIIKALMQITTMQEIDKAVSE
ncbi:MAG TPA: GspE/PulE family protein [Candidatus Pacearchaeota archaeon]|nr:GspE/PulE family protein [Candidatus Pacearchaeota archaeon]HPM08312.1 GspE/PulE family protein [Candidatus Pacearchaeota archaeon]HQI74555.1 GspE/PulE family protein [Candidatus Pacearchaeota archaeon]